MAKTKTKKINLSKKSLLLIFSMLILLCGSYWYWHHTSGPSTSIAKQPKNNPYVNLKPATPQQKQVSENSKDLPPTSSTTTTNSSAKKTITPIISSASKTGVSAYIQGVNEDGGTCTATFTQNGTSKVFTSKGVSNVSYTSCGYMSVSGLGDGPWFLVVTYSSDAASGTSQQVEVN